MERKIFVVMENCEYEYEATVTNVLGAYSKFEDAVNAVKSTAAYWLNVGFKPGTKKDIGSVDFHESGFWLDNVGDEAPYDHVTLYIEELELHE